MGEIQVPALRGASLQVRRGEAIGIMGPSGSGKTTMLNLIGALDRPTSGTVVIDNVDITKLGAGAGANAYGINFLNPFSGLTVTDSDFIGVDPGDYTRVIGIFAGNNNDISDFDISGSLFKYMF